MHTDPSPDEVSLLGPLGARFGRVLEGLGNNGASVKPGSGGIASVSMAAGGVEILIISTAGDSPEPLYQVRRGVRLSGDLGNEGSRKPATPIQAHWGADPGRRQAATMALRSLHLRLSM